jgi:hypothetical protein
MPALKEPQFFSYLGENFSPHPEHIRKDPWNLEDYCLLFRGAAPGQTIGEASTSYLYRFQETIGNIRAIYGRDAKKIKILGILRNPVERAWSIYSLKKQGGGWKKDFFSVIKDFEKHGNRFQYWNFIHSGRYAEQVRAFQNFFPDTKFFLFDELKGDPARVVQECLMFLGVHPPSIPSNIGTSYNFSGVPRSRLVDPLYRLVFHKSRMKNSLKPLVPGSVRSFLKYHLGRLISEKQAMPDAARSYLGGVFSKDIRALSELMPSDEQKQILNRWLEGIV